MAKAGLLALAAAALASATAAADGAAQGADAFVRTDGRGGFALAGKPFRFSGTNCYYLIYEDAYMVDDLFARVAAANMTVVRTWAFLDIGRADGSGSVGGGAKNGVAFQYYDDAAGGPVVNTSALVHLDAVLAAAGRYGVRVVLTLENNWQDFGGADQYVRWLTWANTSYTSPYHDDFYSHPTIKAWYKAWVATLLNRNNSLTGRLYKDDPTIFAWTLANEARCQGSGDYPSSEDCVTDYAKYDTWPASAKILPWAAEMSAYIKSIDANHLVAVGDEGWACESYQTCSDTTCDCYYGVDSANMTALPTVDYATAHLYPSSWGKAGSDGGAAWGTAWIVNHTSMARGYGKPFVLEEYGVEADHQPAVYGAWGATLVQAGAGGDLVWMMAGREDGACAAVGRRPPPPRLSAALALRGRAGDSRLLSPPHDRPRFADSSASNGWYPNYDGFAVYCPNATDPTPPGGNPATCGVLAAHAAAMAGPTAASAAAGAGEA